MFSAWCGTATRSTMDIDLLGSFNSRSEVIIDAMKDVCLIEVEADGISFNAGSLEAFRIAEDAECEGMRLRVQGNLGNARVTIQIDIGFGDVIIPEPMPISYPTLLHFPCPKLKGYTMESMIAEKFQAMIKLGVLNSRMKDFYDIWFLSCTFDFEGKILVAAVKKTFEKRNTAITLRAALFDPSFGKDKNKHVQWRAFIKKSRIVNAPQSFEDVINAVKLFLKPLASSVAEGRAFNKNWIAPGAWR